MKLDRIDIKILTELQRNGRITNVNLADAVGLSASPCLQRTKRLEEAGYIVGYGGHLNIAKLGETVTIYTEITLADEDAARMHRAGGKTVGEVFDVDECLGVELHASNGAQVARRDTSLLLRAHPEPQQW